MRKGEDFVDITLAAQGDEMGLDQTVGAGTANIEGQEEEPEGRHFGRVAQNRDRRHQQRAKADRLDRRRLDSAVAIGWQAEIGWAIAHQQQYDQRRQQDRADDNELILLDVEEFLNAQ